jgi:alkylation response protein AidB-like acyl-CoA dehydrogenase
MDFKCNDTQQMLIDSAARLMRNHSGVEYWRKRRALADGCDAELWGKFAELGWLALAVPDDSGGLGGSLEDVALLMAELGRTGRSCHRSACERAVASGAARRNRHRYEPHSVGA